ncbi:MAG: hypothetical protein A2Y22_05425 [Clostridiales bacterium GWD2_32_59]|nr:MAG: hypothetical protein A2Y22_05425 [Clostridiales bacterium GWD2_32_59]
MKKIYVVLLILILVITLNKTNVLAMILEYDGQMHEYTASPIKLMVNGEVVNTEVPSVILEGRTMVPARDVFEKLGAKVQWDEKYKQVYITYGGKAIILIINNKTVYINQISSELDVPAKLINGKTMIPAAFVARGLGFNVDWNGARRIVSIQDKDLVIDDKDKVVLGYATYYYNGDKASYNSIIANKGLLDQVITHTYTVDDLGNLKGLIPIDQINFAKANNIDIKFSVSNQFDANVAKNLLESSANRTKLISNILIQMQEYGYSGVCIDIEHVYPTDRQYMTKFMEELYKELQPKGYRVAIALPAKTYDNKTGAWEGAFDYKALAPYADQFVLMTYDEHYPQGTPGSIASISWVQNVVKYATSVLPEEKILLGLAAYGYDWSSNGTKSYTISKAYGIATKYGATVNFDAASQSSYYEYTDANEIKHEVWFENEKSITSKLDIVNDYNLQGISIWALGYETLAYISEISKWDQA